MGGQTEVVVRLTERWGMDPFGGGQYTRDEHYLLEELDGEWRIVEPGWPLHWCPPASRAG